MKANLEKVNTSMNYLVLKPTKNIDELELNSDDVINVARTFIWWQYKGHFRKPIKKNGVEYYHGFAIRGDILLSMGFNHAGYEHNNSIVPNHYYIKYRDTFIPVYLSGWATTEKEVYIERVH